MREVTGKLHLQQTQLAHSKTQNELQIRDTVAKYESIAVLFKENDNFYNEGQDIDGFRLTHSCLIVFSFVCNNLLSNCSGSYSKGEEHKGWGQRVLNLALCPYKLISQIPFHSNQSIDFERANIWCCLIFINQLCLPCHSQNYHSCALCASLESL